MQKLTVLSIVLSLALLCTACGGNDSIDFTGKNAEQSALAIKELSPKIIHAYLQPTVQGPSIVCLTWLTDAKVGSSILMEQHDIRVVLQKIATAKGNGGIGSVLILLNEMGVDKLGNHNPVLAVKLAWDMNMLKQVNWKSVEDWQLTEISSLEGLGPFGKSALKEFCKDAINLYGAGFCKRAGF